MSLSEIFTEKFFHSFFSQVENTEDSLNDAYVLLVSKLLDLPSSQDRKMDVMVKLDTIYKQYEKKSKSMVN